MQAIYPAGTPSGIAYTPAFKFKPGSQLVALGLITPERNGTIRHSIEEQTEDCFSNLSDVFGTIKGNAKLAKVTRYMTDVREVWATQQMFEKACGSDLPPSTLLEVHSCSHPDARIELDVYAVIEAGEPPLRRSAGTPFPAVIVLDPTRALVKLHGAPSSMVGQSISSELSECIDKVDAEVVKAGGSASDIVKITLLLTDMRLLEQCRETLTARYGENAPVFVPFAVSKVWAKGARVEVEADFEVPSAKLSEGFGKSTDLCKALVLLSGSAAVPIYNYKVAMDYLSYKNEASIGEQTRICLGNIERALHAAGRTKADVFKTFFYSSDMREWPDIEEAAKEFFEGEIPNPSVVEILKYSVPGVRLEVDLWA